MAEQNQQSNKLIYNPDDKGKKRITWLQNRWEEMDSAYKKKKLDKKWDTIDKQYHPHKYTGTGLKRWQSDNAKNIAFTKVQTALSILIDQNPERQLFAKSKAGEMKLSLWKKLLEFVDDVGNAKAQWQDFVFDASKYGTAMGQNYWRFEQREVVIEGKKEKITDFNNPYWRCLPIREVRLDEKAKSWDPKSEDFPRDWFRRRVYDFSDIKRKYPEQQYPDIKFVKPGDELKDEKEMKSVMEVGKSQVEELYYESWIDDKQSVLLNGVLIKNIPIPFRHKKLSLFGANWWKRSTDDIYGLGLPEVMEHDETLIDKINNTNVDQIILDIYKVLIIGLGEELEDEELELEPNKILRLRNPDAGRWLTSGEKAGRTKFDAMAAIEKIKEDIDEKTGITKQLAGALVGKTATETAINREAGLRRLKTPLDYLEQAMEWQSKLQVSTIKQIYELPGGEKEIPYEGLRGLIMKRKVPIYKTLRLGVKEKIEEKQKKYEPSEKFSYIEVTPDLLFEEPDIKIKHLSTIPFSKALEEQRMIQTFSLNMKLPYTDIYKAQVRLNRCLGEDPEDWMMSEKEIIQMQKDAQGFTTGTVEKEIQPSSERITRGAEEGVAEVPIQQKKGGIFSKTMEKLGLTSKQ